MLVASVPAVPLHVFIPLLRIKCGSSSQPSDQPLPLLPRNFLASFSTCSTLGPFPRGHHCFCGAMAAVKIARLQDLGGAMSKRLQWISASRKITCLHRNPPLISCEARSTSKKLLHLLPNSRFYQCSLLPKKERWKQTSAFHLTSFHSVPPEPITTSEKATPRTESSRLHRGHGKPLAKVWCSWRRSIVMSLCRSMITWKRKYAQILTSHGRSWYLCSLGKSKLYDSIWRIFPLILFR